MQSKFNTDRVFYPLNARVLLVIACVLAVIGCSILWKTKPRIEAFLIGAVVAMLKIAITDLLFQTDAKRGTPKQLLSDFVDDDGDLGFLKPLRILSNCIEAPLIQELAFRGSLQQFFCLFMDFRWALLLQAILFASPLGHCGRRGVDVRSELTGRFALVISGLTYGLIAEWGTIWAAIAAHSFHNAGVHIFLYWMLLFQKGKFRFIRIDQGLEGGFIKLGSKVWQKFPPGEIVEICVENIDMGRCRLEGHETHSPGEHTVIFGAFSPYVVVQVS